MVSMMWKTSLSIFCMVSSEESASMLQTKRIPNEDSESKQDSNTLQTSTAPKATKQYTMSHSLFDENLLVSVDGPAHAVSVKMKEFSLLKTDKISFLSGNGTISEQAPLFRSFRAVDGPGRAQLNADGTLFGWFKLGGRLVRLTQDPVTGLSDLHLLSFQPHKDPANYRHVNGDKFEIEVTEDGKQARIAIDAEDDGNQTASVPHGGTQDEFESAGLAVDGYGNFAPTSDFKAEWNSKGDRWYGGGSCFKDDDTLHEMNIGIVVDYQTTKLYTDWQSKIAGMVNEASVIYENQLHIDLKVGFWIAPDSEWQTPQALFNPTCATYNIQNELNRLKSYFTSTDPAPAFNYDNVATAHMFTGCKMQDVLSYCTKYDGATCVGWSGTVGLAWVGTLCRKGQGGVNMLANGWRTFAHELGHNFGAGHSFEHGQGQTGGIMDYGSAKQTNFKGIPQFNTPLRRTEVCTSLTSRLPACTATAFRKSFVTTPGLVPTPPPAPKPVATPVTTPVSGNACTFSTTDWGLYKTASSIEFSSWVVQDKSFVTCIGQCASRSKSKKGSAFAYESITGKCLIAIGGFEIQYYDGSGFVMYKPHGLSSFSVQFELAGMFWSTSTAHSDYSLSLEECAKKTESQGWSFFIYPGDVLGQPCSIAQSYSVQYKWYGTGTVGKFYQK